MKSNIKAIYLAIVLCVICSDQVAGQVTYLGNDATFGDYVGCDNNTTIPLTVMTQARYPIHWYTDSLRRMILNESLTNQNVNGYTGLDLSGYLGLGGFPGANNGYTVPSALLHLDDTSTAKFGYRDYMQMGLLSTRDEALFYAGLLGRESGIVWSRVYSSGSGDPEPLRFIFTDDNNANTQANDSIGLELGRFVADTTLDEGYFGVGDFASASASPDERIDVLDRTIRVRQLPDTLYMDSTLGKVVVVDSTGRFYWRGINTFPGNDTSGTDLDWYVTPINDVVTAWTNAMDYPDDTSNVGIGIEEPIAKLDVLQAQHESGGITAAIKASVITVDTNNIAVDAFALGTSEYANIGVRSYASRARRQYGVYSEAIGLNPDLLDVTVGAYGYALGLNKNTVGVWGVGVNPVGNAWGGWFDGQTYCTTGMWSASDETYKTNIADIQNASDVLVELQPKSYQFNHQDYAYLGFDNTPQFGLLSQDVQQVLPELVRTAVRPAQYDSTNTLVAPETDILAMNYQGFIPLLIQGFKEQQVRIEQIEAIVMDCCSSFDGMQGPNGSDDGGLNDMKSKENELHQNRPNPFKNNTRIDYDLVADGNVELIITDINGVQIDKLVNETQRTGSYSLDWNTDDLSPGIYFYSLMVDGQLWVKKAIKIQ